MGIIPLIPHSCVGPNAGGRSLEQSIFLQSYDAVLTWLVIPDKIENWEEDGRADLDPEEFTLRRKHWPGRK
jgi:hypothetical protein